ncbi:uncharacterized protein LAJ45_10949 [Morchella importuna]|nr:uncharacterized protein LAJ45_10949 [Morchella importuna]KAH8145038.1 hypothetical protein LAJ45_10949 [Morchella importuna]
MAIISPPATGPTSQKSNHSNEPNASTTGHQHRNLKYSHSIQNGTYAELAHPNRISIASTTGASLQLVECPVRSSTVQTSSFYNRPSSSPEDCSEEPSASDDDDNYGSEAEVDGEFEWETEPTPEATGFHEVDPSPEVNSEEPVALGNDNGQPVWNDFDFSGSPIDFIATGYPLQDNFTEPASIVPHAMGIDQWGGYTKLLQTPLIDMDMSMDISLDDGPKQYITTTRIMDMSPEPSFPQCQWDTMGARHIQVCLGVRPGINQLHNDPSAGVNPKDIFHDHQR